MIPVSPTRTDIDGRLKRIAEHLEPLYLHGDDLRPDIRFLLAELARVEAERDAVYALGKIPVEQSQQIPLALWVQTRFVHVEDFNALAARFEDMARRVKDFQSAEADLRELRSKVVDKNGWDDDYYKMALHHAEQRLEAAELALLALQTETHDGK